MILSTQKTFLADELDADDEWLLSYRQIADRLGLSNRTVERAIRQVAVTTEAPNGCIFARSCGRVLRREFKIPPVG